MSDKSNLLTVDMDRLWSTIERSGEIGTIREIGLARLALDDNDKIMREQFVEWCEEVGASVSVDRVGNVFARRAGRDDGLPPVLIGGYPGGGRAL